MREWVLPEILKLLVTNNLAIHIQLFIQSCTGNGEASRVTVVKMLLSPLNLIRGRGLGQGKKVQFKTC